MNYVIGVLRLILINTISTTGYVLLAGWTGIFSLGHAGFIAIGAYTTVLLMIRAHIPWFIAVTAGSLLSACVAWAIGKPSLKLKAGYFAIASLGFGETVRLLIENMEIIGGPRGVTGIDRSYSSLIVLVVIVVVGIIAIIHIRNSRFGRMFFAIRDDALAAEAMGIHTAKAKETALIISAIYCGIGGGFYASYMGYIQPAMFSGDMSSYLSTWVVFGGLGSLTGGVLATAILTGLTEAFRTLSQYRMFFYGIALVLIISLRPKGVFGTWELTPANIRKLFRRKGQEKKEEA